ncbi:MAG: hypothetical protein JWO82_751, partial [Akkermansiaceae bacterium]|nr:hypothetical protein [Akkermansiaceae bacterium]
MRQARKKAAASTAKKTACPTVEHAAIDYARSVIDGDRIACKWVILAC